MLALFWLAKCLFRQSNGHYSDLEGDKLHTHDNPDHGNELVNITFFDSSHKSQNNRVDIAGGNTNHDEGQGSGSGHSANSEASLLNSNNSDNKNEKMYSKSGDQYEHPVYVDVYDFYL